MDIEPYVRIVTLLLLVLFFAFRSRFTRHYKKFTPRVLVKYVVLVIIFVPYLLGWFDFAFLRLWTWLRVVGVIIMVLGLWVFFLSHKHLGKNWSPVIEKKFSKSKKLVKSGPYSYVRHPIYLASFVVLVGLFLFTANLIVAGIPFVILILFYAYKVPREEKELVENFGREYREYMLKTPRLLP